MKKLSYIMFVLGAVLIASAMAFLISNIREELSAEDFAREAGEQVSSSIQESKNFSEEYDVIPDYLLNPEIEMAKVDVESYSYIGNLSIPSLGLELPIMDQWSYPGLKIAPGRYAGSAYSSPFVICGHNYKSHFGMLSTLAYKDLIVFTDMDGNEFQYQVERIETIEPTDKENVVSDDWALTLFTCTPGGKTRVVVHCSSLTNESKSI